jgi:hypothetical protein
MPYHEAVVWNDDQHRDARAMCVGKPSMSTACPDSLEASAPVELSMKNTCRACQRQRSTRETRTGLVVSLGAPKRYRDIACEMALASGARLTRTFDKRGLFLWP